MSNFQQKITRNIENKMATGFKYSIIFKNVKNVIFGNIRGKLYTIT